MGLPREERGKYMGPVIIALRASCLKGLGKGQVAVENLEVQELFCCDAEAQSLRSLPAEVCLKQVLQHKVHDRGTYLTHEAKGSDDAQDADTAIINAEGGHSGIEDKKEYFI
ncbi:cell adhesion molecule 3 isoform X1 [Tachysurus ichikawai]